MVPRKGAVRPLMRRCYKGVGRLSALAGAEAALQHSKRLGAYRRPRALKPAHSKRSARLLPRKGAVRPLMRRCYKGVRRLPALAGQEARAPIL